MTQDARSAARIAELEAEVERLRSEIPRDSAEAYRLFVELARRKGREQTQREWEQLRERMERWV